MKYTEKEQKNIRVIETILSEVYSKGKTDLIPELIHEDFVNYHEPEGMRDRTILYKVVDEISSTFDSFSVKAVQIFAKDDMVAMMDNSIGISKNGKFEGVDFHIFKMKDGKMYQHWNSFRLPSQAEKMMVFFSKK